MALDNLGSRRSLLSKRRNFLLDFQFLSANASENSLKFILPVTNMLIPVTSAIMETDVQCDVFNFYAFRGRRDGVP